MALQLQLETGVSGNTLREALQKVRDDSHKPMTVQEVVARATRVAERTIAAKR